MKIYIHTECRYIDKYVKLHKTEFLWNETPKLKVSYYSLNVLCFIVLYLEFFMFYYITKYIRIKYQAFQNDHNNKSKRKIRCDFNLKIITVFIISNQISKKWNTIWKYIIMGFKMNITITNGYNYLIENTFYENYTSRETSKQVHNTLYILENIWSHQRMRTRNAHFEFWVVEFFSKGSTS